MTTRNVRTRALLAGGALAAATTILLGLQAADGASADGHRVRHLAVPLTSGPPAVHVPQPGGSGGRVIPNRSGPSRVPVPANVDGCDHDYGTTNQCVPWSIQGATTAARCDWLTAHGFGPLKVYGKDRQHLDSNKDGTACGSGDRTPA
ncbi:hypothetical protein ABUW04_32685 [Streptacidiphilus sp. N1-10]|uniref:Excalibur calcium-binding domain-containing protein n=1 Tax=Streptacidiphilus jeojiensis TaxID=3229225 RepID=A0ABV6XXK6_9ACTN